MNLYKELNEKQIKLLEETGKTIEDKNYSIEELKQIQDTVASYIFSKSKKDIEKEISKYSDILRIIG